MQNDKIYMREYMRKYNLEHAEKTNKIILCGLCNSEVKQCNLLKHNKSIKHSLLEKKDKLMRYEMEEKIKELKEGFSKEELDLLLEKKNYRKELWKRNKTKKFN